LIAYLHRRTIRHFSFWSMALLCCLLLGACTLRSQKMTLNASDVESSTANIVSVQNSLAIRAGLRPGFHGLDSDYWFQVTLAGFNFVDEKCNAFLDDLYRAQRRLRAAKNEINDISSAVVTILSYTATSRNDIGVVAAAFGLASNTVTNAEIAFLVDLGPDRVKTLVDRTRKAYRAEVNRNGRTIFAQALAMDSIAGYLDLCRVSTITSQVGRVIDGTTPAARSDGNPASPSIFLVGGEKAPAGVLREGSGLPRFVPKGPTAPVVKHLPPKGVRKIKGARPGTYETRISFKKGMALQNSLCVPETGDFEDANTRRAIEGYETGSNEVSGNPNKRGYKIDVDGIINTESQYIEIRDSGECRDHQNNYKTAYEKFGFPDTTNITALQRTILQYIAGNFKKIKSITGSDIPHFLGSIDASDPSKWVVNNKFITGVFDSNTREAISIIANTEGIKQTIPVITPELRRLIGQGAKRGGL